MKLQTSTKGFHKARVLALFCLVSAAMAGCATSTSRTHTPARIELQDQVGFTIIEEERISNSVRTDYEGALSLLERGQHEQGIAVLAAVAEDAPLLSAPHIDLGIAWHMAGDLEAAEASLLTALELNPDHPIVHNELGIIYRKSGRFAESRKSYEAALAVYPGYHYARRNLAVLCDLYLADLQCALQNYEAYMTTVDGDDEATMWIADIRSRINQ